MSRAVWWPPHRRRELYVQMYYVQIYLQIDVVKLKFLTQS